MSSFPDRVKELRKLMERYIRGGRSVLGLAQSNYGPLTCPQLHWMNQNSSEK